MKVSPADWIRGAISGGSQPGGEIKIKVGVQNILLPVKVCAICSSTGPLAMVSNALKRLSEPPS
jgi:hypothetical protein